MKNIYILLGIIIITLAAFIFLAGLSNGVAKNITTIIQQQWINANE